MSRIVRVATEAMAERPMLTRALVCGQLALEATSPRMMVAVLMAGFLDAKASPRGGRPLTPIRIVDELEAAGLVRVTEWPEVEVLVDCDRDVPDAAALTPWLDSILRCSELMRRAAA